MAATELLDLQRRSINNNLDGFTWKFGDGTNYIQIDANGDMSFVAGATISSAVQVDGTLTANGKLCFGTSSELTISGGVVSITKSVHRIDTEGDAASDDLNTINGGAAGDILFLRAQDGARTVVCKDGAGNLYLAGDCTLDSIYDMLVVINFGSTAWYEVSRSDNAA